MSIPGIIECQIQIYIITIWEDLTFSSAPALASWVQAARTAESLILEIQMQSHLWMIFDKQLQFPG